MVKIPYEQGNLDGLCGIYSVINATRLIAGRFSKDEASELFGEILKHIEAKKCLWSVLTEGLGLRDMIGILKNFIEKGRGIHVRRPFLSNRQPPTERYLNEIRVFLDEGSKRAVIISLENDEWLQHWTVVKSVSAKEIHFFDSSSMKKFNKKRCTTKTLTLKRPYRLDPSATFFLARKKLT